MYTMIRVENEVVEVDSKHELKIKNEEFSKFNSVFVKRMIIHAMAFLIFNF